MSVQVNLPSVEVRIPTVFRPYTGGASQVTAAGRTLGEVLVDLDTRHPGLCAKVLEDGQLCRYINLYVNEADVRYSGGLDTTVNEGDSVVILPAVAGG
jgi:sulfur-carrier protein